MFFFPVVGSDSERPHSGSMVTAAGETTHPPGSRDRCPTILVSRNCGARVSRAEWAGGSNIEHRASSMGRTDGLIEVGENAAFGKGRTATGTPERQCAKKRCADVLERRVPHRQGE